VSVEFFKDKVLQWQITLGNVEEVLKVSTHILTPPPPMHAHTSQCLCHATATAILRFT
jgi:hypothetical protein